ncbi:type 4a pilus biogenesis lipoprotein PilP [Niveibacterium umoris]|uniref:Type IV pilus assembly protein PilP n=1 Tax=Niveibacterium umoris TaxID=1193620 RepID=A0A840BPE4_9RHOO|nr:pilus assembly protein PilP [Niveibacterium umoris]MBB4013339.1 type IV pilus assembly protein PilP [Niveibacterium umoris]
MKIAPSRAISGVTVALALAVLSGCGGGDHAGVRQWMEESSKDLKGRVPPLPQLQTFPVVAYDAGALIDPFRPAKIEAAKGGGGGAKPDLNRRREPLESYPLESLRMVGILSMKGKPMAIISADKTLYQVGVGNYMGQNFGVITNVSESEITLKELIEDTNGDWVERVNTLQLQEATK